MKPQHVLLTFAALAALLAAVVKILTNHMLKTQERLLEMHTTEVERVNRAATVAPEAPGVTPEPVPTHPWDAWGPEMDPDVTYDGLPDMTRPDWVSVPPGEGGVLPAPDLAGEE